MRIMRYGSAIAFIAASCWALAASAAVMTTQSMTQSLTNDNAADVSITGPTAGSNTGDLGTIYTTEDRNGSISRVLIRFDLPALPPQATVVKAELSVRLFQTIGTSSWTVVSDPVDVGVYQVLTSWDESKATWIKRDSSNNWATAGMANGTERASTALDTLNTGGVAGYKTWDITSLYKQWQAGTAENNGLAIITEAHPANDATLRWFTSEYSASTSRPYLTVTYQVPEPAGASILLGMGGLVLSRWRR